MLDGLEARPAIYQAETDLQADWLQTDPGILYLRSNRIFGTRQNRYGLMEKLVNVLHEEIAPKRPFAVIVDLRLNTGGDFFNTIAFSQALPGLLPTQGRVYVLVGPVTFSAALVTAAMLRQNGGERVVLVGERMGDDPVFWSEGVPFELPQSHIRISPASSQWNLRDGCQDVSRCYFAGALLGPRGVSLEPDVPVATSFADYAAGKDPVLDAALQRARTLR